MKPILIEQLYTQRECEIIREMYSETTDLIQEAIGTKLITTQDKIVTTNSIDSLYLICSTAKFASSEDECQRVAITIHQYHNKPLHALPSIVEDRGIKLAHKTLIALSFYPQMLTNRWKYKGAPTPAYYRKLSKYLFEQDGQFDIALHHEQWEGFLGEMFV